MKLIIAPGSASRWAHGDLIVDGEVELADPTPELVAAVAAAAAAGAVTVVDADKQAEKALAAAVETDEESVRRQPALQAAQDDNAKAAHWAALTEEAAYLALTHDDPDSAARQRARAGELAGMVRGLDCDPQYKQRVDEVMGV